MNRAASARNHRTSPERISPAWSEAPLGCWTKQASSDSKAQRWVEAMINQRGIQGVRVLQKLLSLTHKHPCDLIDKACQIAQTYGEYPPRAAFYGPGVGLVNVTPSRITQKYVPLSLTAFSE